MHSTPQLTETVLKNGMRAICIQAPSKIARINILIAVGSADDEKNYGTAHLLEHLLINGERNRPAYQSFLDWEHKGLFPYAETGYKITRFACKGMAEKIPPIIPELAQKIFTPAFSGKQLKQEQRIILEEYREYKEDEEAQVALHRNLFPKYPEIWHSALGYPASIRKLTLKICRNFHQTWYGAQNTLCVYSGPDPAEKIVSALETLSVPIAKQKTRIPVTPLLPVLQNSNINKQAYSGIMICTEVPRNFLERQKIKMLHRYVEAELFEKLRVQKGLIYGIDSDWEELPCNVHMLKIPVQTRRIPAVTLIAQEVMHALFEGHLSNKRIRALQKQLKWDRQPEQKPCHEHQEEQINDIAEAWLSGASVEDLRKQNTWNIDRNELKKLARTYFHPDRIGILQLIP